MPVCSMGQKAELKVAGRTVQVSSLDKVLFPETKFTKAQLIDYYVRAAPALLPHLKRRPVTLKLYLSSVDRKPEYIKEAPSYTPRWVKRAAVWRRDRSSQIHYLLVNDLPSLVWAVNLNNIEFHALLARAPRVERPTAVVFDLDPGPPANVLDCAQAALELRNILHALNLEALVKSSGSKGLHVWVPLNTPVTYEQTLPFAKAIAETLEEQAPEHFTARMAKNQRRGKVFVDYSQNSDFKTTAIVYSLRARPDGPFVSCPFTWTELEAACRDGDEARFFPRPELVVQRIEERGDLFAAAAEKKQKLPKVEGLAELIRPKRKPSPAKPAPRLLRAYEAKRNFTVTAEPTPAKVRRKASAQKLRYVIQKHAASHLHYDFRLEMEGVLRSWAVPKGPPLKKGERRLAMHVEDHPLDYGNFEGIIPKGQYGGGTVMVWDKGEYEERDQHPVRAYHQGTLHLTLRGKKLKGAWTLVRLKRREGERSESWLLMKSGEDARPLPARTAARSVLTRRTMEEIAAQADAVWESNR